MKQPVSLPQCQWQFPSPDAADEHGFVGVGADLDPSTLIHGYSNGMFPMPVGDGEAIGWWSPPLRGVLPLDQVIISRSLRRSCRRYDVTINADFRRVIRACSELPRQGGWISDDIIDAYVRLHDLGWAHSVEAWSDGELVGGLYGVQVGGLFAGESMFHVATDASKVALVGLVSALREVGAELLDVQWSTPHLATLGVQELTRRDYLALVSQAIASPAGTLDRLSAQIPLSSIGPYLDRIRLEPTGSSSS